MLVLRKSAQMKLNFLCKKNLSNCNRGNLIAKDIGIALFPNTTNGNHEYFHKIRGHCDTFMVYNHLKDAVLRRPNNAQPEPASCTRRAFKEKMKSSFFNAALDTWHSHILHQDAYSFLLNTFLVLSRSPNSSQVLNLMRGMHLDFQIRRKGAGGAMSAKWRL